MAVKKQKKPVPSGKSVDSGAQEAQVPPSGLTASHFPIVGIGASAGGLEALERFFNAVPPAPGMAFVIIQHLDPTHPSAMATLLKRHTQMPVTEAEEQPVEIDHVYVMPPTKIMTLEAGRKLRLRDRVDQPEFSLIDVFFRSLADEMKERAVGIILSGTGRDGTLGAKAIKAGLGMVMVQDPETARYDGMPRAAISNGVADYVRAPQDMPVSLIEYIRQSHGIASEKRREMMENQTSDMQKIFSIIRLRTKRDFSGYKLSTLNRRIERRMSVNRIETLSEYTRFLTDNPRETEALFKDLLINVTQFFRDPPAFDVLKNLLLERLSVKKDGDTVRAWTAGCSTGEEPYSLAILLQECVEQLGKYLEIQVFGTDIDADAIITARAGAYPAAVAEDLGEDRARRFFVRTDNQLQVKKELREKLVFAIQDITNDPPFSRMDLISVRNVLIYLGGDLQRRLIPVLHYALRGDGILFLGTAESIGAYADFFQVHDSKWKIYGRGGSPDLHVPLPAHTTWNDLTAPQGLEAIVGNMSEKSLLQALGPSVLVDSSFRIVYVHGETSRFLELAQGEVNMSIMDMARPELRAEISSALTEANANKKPVLREGVRIVRDGSVFVAAIAVQPILGIPDRHGYAVVSFTETLEVPAARKGGDKGKGDTRVQQLERELQYTRENLRSTIEELETANEELRSANEEYQSTNEELQSANEELETSREELQSVNEELMTVNNEYQNKIDELSVINDDMMNLLNSSNIATIFLDNALQIKRYTPYATRIFNLIGTDVGRPLGHLTSNLELKDLVEQAQKVLDSLAPFREEVQTRDGHWYSMRLHPYRTTGDAIAGVVLSFIDINEYVADKIAVAERLRAAQDFVLRLASTRTPALVLDAGLRIVTANDAFRRLVPPPVQDGQGIYEAHGGAWNTDDMHALLEGDVAVRDRRVQIDFPRIGRRSVRVDSHLVAGKESQGVARFLAFSFEDPTG
ncbi:MAG: chemotaxis protein CheB [Spirochaetia bacterium]|jgi:two-component system CheB/CheR fusion protein